MAVKDLKNMSDSRLLREYEEARQKYLMDEYFHKKGVEEEKLKSREEGIKEGIKEGRKGVEEEKLKSREEGIKEGKEEGKEEFIKEVVLNMLKMKSDISFISKVTGLSEDEINKIKSKKKL